MKHHPIALPKKFFELNDTKSQITMGLDWLCIIGALVAMHYFQSVGIKALGLLLLASRQHALLVLMHEGVHLRLNQNRKINNFLSDVFAAYPILADTQCYRAHHMLHHQHLNTDQDPDWCRKVGLADWQFPKTKWQMVWLFFKLFLIAPVEWLRVSSYFLSGARRIYGAKSWLYRCAYFGAIVAVSFALNAPEAPLYWFGALFFVFPVLQRIRSISEHFGLPNEHAFNMTRDLRPGWLEGFFIAPHGVHFHLVHHEHAGIPWYNLKEARTWLMKEDAVFRKTAHQNDGFFIGKASVLKDLLRTYPKVLEKSEAA